MHHARRFVLEKRFTWYKMLNPWYKMLPLMQNATPWCKMSHMVF